MKTAVHVVVGIVTILVGLGFLASPWATAEGLGGPTQVAIALGVGVCLVVAGGILIKQSEADDE